MAGSKRLPRPGCMDEVLVENHGNPHDLPDNAMKKNIYIYIYHITYVKYYIYIYIVYIYIVSIYIYIYIVYIYIYIVCVYIYCIYIYILCIYILYIMCI